jgi:hypothetical protein
MRPPSLFILALCALSVTGCEVKKRERGKSSRPEKTKTKAEPEKAPTPAELGPGFAAAKEALLGEPRNCFFPDTDVCLQDDAIIAEVLAKVMTRPGVKKRVGQELPASGKDLEFVLKQAGSAFRLAQQATPERRTQIEERVKSRYAKPVVSRKGRVATADHGYLPGPIEAYRNGWRVKGSPLGGGGTWKGQEIGRFLGQLAAAHPDAQEYQLVVKAPNSGSFAPITITYVKAADRIRLDNRPTKVNYYLSKKLGGDFGNLETRGISLVPKEMYSCSTKAVDVGGPCTPALAD